MAKYNYTVSTNNIWTSFDFGEVEADNIEDARKLAIEQLTYDFAKANDALAHCDNTIGFTISFNPDDVTLTIKS